MPIRFAFSLAILLLCCTIVPNGISAQTKKRARMKGSQVLRNPTIAPPDTAKVGIYVTSLYDLNLNDGSYKTDFWMWFVTKNDSLKLLQSAELSNAKDFTYNDQDVEVKGKSKWYTQNCRATIKQDWDIEYFPFDRQTLKLELEEATVDTSRLVYVADKASSRYDPNIDLRGWKIKSFGVNAGYRQYKTNFGDPSLPDSASAYPKFVATMELQRVGTGLFIKLFTGLYVAFLISWLAFFIPPGEVDPRFGLSVGGLFAAVGNKYIVDNILPDIVATSLADRIHSVTFIAMLITILTSVISLYLDKKGEEKKYKRLDRITSFVLLIVYIAVNCYFVFDAVRHQ